MTSSKISRYYSSCTTNALWNIIKSMSGKIFETGTMESWGAGGEPQRNLNGTSAEVKEEKCSKNLSKLLKKLLELKKVLNCSKNCSN